MGRELLPFALLLLLMVAGFYNEADYKLGSLGWPPDIENEPAQIQIRETAIHPGDTFKGRSVTLLEMNHPSSIDWSNKVFPILFSDYTRSLGSDLMNDARVFGVPVANEYGHWIAPRMLALFATAFYDKRDEIHRAAQAPRVFRPNLARLMGTSLVVSDAPIPGETQIYESPVSTHPLYLTRVSDTNLGQFSPTHTVLAHSAQDSLDQLQAPDFDGRTLAVVEAPIPERLVPAENVVVRIDRGPILHVTAHSSETSLLILPFGWSACLQAEGPGLKRMVPVNLAQIGLLIEGDAAIDIRYRYGLISGSTCRKQDLESARDLGLDETATGRLFRDFHIR